MGLDGDEVSRAEFVARRAPGLLRLAHQLTGAPDQALTLVCHVGSDLPRRGAAADLDQAAVAGLVRGATRRRGRRAGVTDAGPLDRLDARRRASTVLAFGLGWDPHTIAEHRRSTERRIRADVAAALRLLPEPSWRELLDEPRWNVPVPADLPQQLRSYAVRRRERRRQLAITLGSAVIAVAGVVTAAARIATAPAPLPPTAHAPGLLSWPPRGSLVRDATFIRSAAQLWHASKARPPVGPTYVLWAGRIGVGRLVVLQAQTGTGPATAVVAEHDVTLHHPRLRLDAVRPLRDVHVPALAVPYDGNLNIPGLAAGPGSAVLQLLAAPGSQRIEERHVAGSFEERPGYFVHRLSDGMSTPWLDVSLGGGVPATAVRVVRANQVIFTATVGHRLQLEPVRARLQGPPARWAGLPVGFGDAATSIALTDDVVWWTEVCHGRQPELHLIWTGRAAGFPDAVRLETLACAGLGPGRAIFLTGALDTTVVLAVRPAARNAYGAVLAPLGGGHPSFVVVGSRAVAGVEVAGKLVHERVAVVPFHQVSGLRVLDRTGRSIRY